MEYLARYFGIDILCYSILSNHFHQVLRQRPDVVAQWNDTEVARRWLMLCPKRKNKDGSAKVSDGDYIELLDWTARVVVPGKRGSTPPDAPPIFERLNLGISPESWCELIKSFGKLFSTVAGKPHIVERYRSSKRKQKFTLKPEARQLLAV